jgi:hypothetical protein
MSAKPMSRTVWLAARGAYGTSSLLCFGGERLFDICLQCQALNCLKGGGDRFLTRFWGLQAIFETSQELIHFGVAKLRLARKRLICSACSLILLLVHVRVP